MLQTILLVKKMKIYYNEKRETVSSSYIDIVSKNRMGILCILGFIFISIIASFSFLQVYALPIIYDDDYIVEKFATGLEFPTTMTFVGDEILVLEKNTGKVILIQDNGVSYNEPALVVPVNFQQEAGLLGITSTSDHIYLYFIESLSGFDDSVSGWSYQVDDRIKIEDSKIVVYQYDWNGKKLINPILIEELPVFHGSHLGGVITTGLNNEVYFVIGDQWRYTTSSGDVITYNIDNTFQNIPVDTIYETGSQYLPQAKRSLSYETGSIFKIDTESNNSVELFAMGIRNSFRLLHLASSTLSTSKFQTSMIYLSRLQMAFDRGGWGDYNIPSMLALGGTPLTECILSAINMVPDFQKRNKVQIVNTIFLTDGQGNGHFSIWNGEEFAPQNYRATPVIIDPVTKKHYQIGNSNHPN